MSLPPNIDGEMHPLHGFGWLAAWDVAQQTTEMCELRYSHAAGNWPWAFEARQKIEIKGNVLRQTLSVQNLSDHDMPCGLGQHPYFPKASTAELKFTAAKVWRARKDGIPTELINVPSDWDFTAGATVTDKSIDNCFAGWDGTAQIIWPNHPFIISIKATPAPQYAVLYINTPEDYFCFEPVTHMNNAINWLPSDINTGLKILKPRQIQTFVTEFSAAASE